LNFIFMYITWLGHSCFKLQDKYNSGTVTIITDPYGKSVGLKMPRVEADIVTISHEHDDHNNLENIKGEPFLIRTAGEYDIKGVGIDGVDSYHDDKQGAERGKNIIFRFDIDTISIVHLGDLGQDLDEKQLEQIATPDILMIPVGGKYTIGPKKAVEVISQIEPRIVIPMHYKSEGVKLDIEGVEKFVKELGLKPRYEEKLKIVKKDLPQEEMELIIFTL
jgi:L-ascorbate metabolism protein UlaG (beta-lactamase superfamily)